MRLVPTAPIRPSRCAVIPFKHKDDEGFIDSGAELNGFDNHVYVSVTAVREMARMIGLPSCEQLTEAETRADALERERDDLQAQLEEADRELNAVHVLKNNRAWTQAQRQGRPKKEAA